MCEVLIAAMKMSFPSGCDVSNYYDILGVTVRFSFRFMEKTSVLWRGENVVIL